MSIPKEILTDYKEIYDKALKLEKEESKYDPPENPFCSFYEALQLLHGLKQLLKNAIASVRAEEPVDDSPEELTYRFILAYVYHEIGRLYVLTGETNEANSAFQACFELVTDFKTEPGAIITYASVTNQITLLQGEREEYAQACELLQKSEELYLNFKANGKVPLTITDLFGTPTEVVAEQSFAELESQYTLCCFYLAQVYGHLKESSKSAQYCHKALRRQLESGNYDPIDFSLNAATLSQYFVEASRFEVARHHLAASTLIMRNYQATLEATTTGSDQQQSNDARESFEHRYADVARCWAKYGIALMQASKDRLFDDTDTDGDGNDDDAADDDNDDKETKPNLDILAVAIGKATISVCDYRFPSLDLTELESAVSCAYCLTFDDAKQVFQFVIGWLDKAKEYYKPETEASEYSRIVFDYADCYKLIAFWEENHEYQIKMQRRRARYYDELAAMLNPTFYMNICRSCWFGAGEAFTTIADMRSDELKEKSTPTPTLKDIKAINLACLNGIRNYELFIKSFFENDGVTWKTGMTTEELRLMLLAHFYVGRLYMKLQEFKETTLSLSNISNSIKYFNICLERSTMYKDAGQLIAAELSLCRELAELLPKKLQLIKNRLDS